MGKMIISDDIEVRQNEDLSRHSTFKVGGRADFAAFPKNAEEFKSILFSLKENGQRYTVIGNGSNVLFDDDGYRGTVIFTKYMNNTEYIHMNDKIRVRAECGKSITELAFEAGKKHLLTGMEFAYGIPGSVGGALFMNAGAYGKQISDIVVCTECYDTASEKQMTISAPEHHFSYRKSAFSENKNLIVLSSVFELREGEGGEIFDLMNKYMKNRKEKQPLDFPSAGSVFKRPADGVYAGKLIEDAGLKGLRVGDAEVSEKHAGFIVNRANASSKDILELIEMVKDKVYGSSGVRLECEVIYIPSE